MSEIVSGEFFSRLRGWWGSIQRWLHPYKPETYYMRGPGPKWRAKHRSIVMGEVRHSDNTD